MHNMGHWQKRFNELGLRWEVRMDFYSGGLMTFTLLDKYGHRQPEVCSDCMDPADWQSMDQLMERAVRFSEEAEEQELRSIEFNPVSSDELRLWRQGDKIPAIKSYRDRTGCELRVCKNALEAAAQGRK